MSDATWEGGCLCGATRYRATGEASHLCFCHCRSCRRASGAPCVAWATFPSGGFRVTHGELARFASSPGVVRGFCPTCGTPLTYARADTPDEIDLLLATLDDPGRLTPAYHIWVSERLPWVSLSDGLPRFERRRRDG